VGDPKILLLDEPCSGLDAESRLRYLDLLDHLAGIYLVFVSHYNDDSPLCTNRLAKMENGFSSLAAGNVWTHLLSQGFFELTVECDPCLWHLYSVDFQ
jgi:energy-coupling factor transporter ATP-binding protein EcfA2